ncbi:tetratricopeptide repeat protein [Microcoleus sp. LAD1_D5]|uniref:tetratricopeptide repeat protein n=1 Tax=unclassified Microcoleus TaxID=2642155 RepID=UPI002FD769F3
MFRQIWQRILNLWRQIQRHFRKPAPPPPKPTPIRTFGEYEQKFLQLLEGVEQGWSRGDIKGFLISSKINDAEWENWLQEFGERLLVSPETNLELGGRMVRLGEMNCGKISEVAGNIGREVLAGESLNRKDEEGRSVISENTDDSSAANQGDSTSQSECRGKKVSQEVEELYKQGVARYELGYLESALDCYDKVIEIKPDFHEAWINRSFVLDRLGRYQEATINYYTAIALQSGNKKVLLYYWHERGYELANLGRYSEAIAAFEKALEIDPKFHIAWNNLGNALKELGRDREAIAAYNKALEIDPKFHFAWNGLGIALTELGRSSEAIAAYKQALEIEPKFHLAWYNLGNALNHLTRYTEAIEAYEIALKIDPEYPRTWLELGNALRELERYTEAEAALKQALEIDPKYHIAWSNLGNILKYLGRYKEAIAALEKALEIDPKYVFAWNGLGATFNDLGGGKEAITAFEKALEIDPKSHIVWSNLGTTLTNFSHYSEAIAAFDRALVITGDQYWEAWTNRGGAFFKSGRYIEAIQNWDEGLQKYLPSNRDYRLACGNLHHQKGQAHYINGKQTATYFESFHKAKASYEQAREFLKSPLIPETYLEVLQGLITVCRSLGDAKTTKYLTEATTVLENLILDNETHPEIKMRLQRKFAGLYQLEVDTLVQSGNKVNALEKAEARKNFCLQWMRSGWQNHTESPTYPQIRDLLANNTETAIIYWHLSPLSLTAFIITLEKFEVISTPLCDLFPKNNSQSLEKWLKNWKTSYQTYGKTTSKQQKKESHPWRESMTAQLQKLADILKIPEICTHLTNLQHLILIPHRDLHLLPLHFLFSDNLFTITYLPSIQVGIDRLDRKPSPSMSLLLVESPDPLLFAEIEAPAIANFHLNCNTISSSQATTDNLKEALQQAADIFHFTGHAYHNTKQPSQSALILKNKQPLTSQEIAQFDLKSYYLICLSACETGITGKEELIDEFVGLASSFLAAGAVYALSTLWIVDEISSALMMIRFYQILNQQRCQNKLHPALALKEAQKWLRTITYSELSNWYLELSEITKDNSGCSKDLRDEANLIRRDRAKIESDKPPYADLYHWAGFTITGKVNP